MIESGITRPDMCELYSRWDIESPSLPARSRFFKLEPIGIGTTRVESLTSYIARLAAEHCVSPRKLLSVEILASEGKATRHYKASPHFSATRINGMGSLTDITATALEQFTLREDLRYLTLLTWSGVLSYQLLLRKQRAWCASCYEERLGARESLYELLIWSFDAITICTKHRERLLDRCLCCASQLPFLATDYRPGYCSKCQEWLGSSNTVTFKKTKVPITAAEISQQLQIQHCVGELIANANSVAAPPSSQVLVSNLVKLIEKNADGSINRFSNIVGIWSGTIRRLLVEETMLTLGNLCQLCSRLDISPLDLLAGQYNEEDTKRRNVIFKEDVPLLRVTVPWSELEHELRATLQEEPPPSMEEVARRMGYYPPKVKRHFPQLCEQIIFRYREYQKSTHPRPEEVLRALESALKESPPSSLQSILRRLGCQDTGYYYYRHYRELCFAITDRFKKYRNNPFNRDEDRERLEAALSEEPPPSFSEVARRFRHNREFIRLKFPELSKAVTTRYAHYQIVLRKQNAERLRYVIRKAVEQLTASGVYASEARVKEYAKQHLPKLGRSILFKQALLEVKSEMGLIS
jgi:DNA-binding Xre family transcriptional regulator